MSQADKFQPQIYASAEEALLKTKRIWEVLADQPSLHKDDVYYLLSLHTDMSHCPCCQYNKQEQTKFYLETGLEKVDSCYFCPLYPISEYGCTKHSEPYHRWTHALDEPEGWIKTKKKAAREFLSLIDEALKQHKESQS